MININQVLLIDDDPITRELVKFFLEERNYEVLEAINGEDGLINFQNSNPSCAPH